MRIVIAEDDATDASMTASFLKEADESNETIVVGDGEELLDYLNCRGGHSLRERTNPCAVLLDIKMPKVNGLEALKAIKESAELKSIPVIMFTSSKQQPDVEQSFLNGANAYVVKPIDLATFRKTIMSIYEFWMKLNEPVLESDN